MSCLSHCCCKLYEVKNILKKEKESHKVRKEIYINKSGKWSDVVIGTLLDSENLKYCYIHLLFSSS